MNKIQKTFIDKLNLPPGINDLIFNCVYNKYEDIYSNCILYFKEKRRHVRYSIEESKYDAFLSNNLLECDTFKDALKVVKFSKKKKPQPANTYIYTYNSTCRLLYNMCEMDLYRLKHLPQTNKFIDELHAYRQSMYDKYQTTIRTEKYYIIKPYGNKSILNEMYETIRLNCARFYMKFCDE